MGKDGLGCFHHRNIQVFAMEIYKVKTRYTPETFSNFFNQKEISPYNLRRHP